jgi:hypothetical protein
VEHLTLKVRHVHHVAVHEAHGAHARRGQIERGGGAQAARPDEQHLGAQELALSLLADVREEEVAAVALDLVAGERRVLHHGQPRLGPALEAALEIDHVGVAEIVQRLGRKHGAQTGLAIEHDGRGWLRRHRADPELEEAAADIGRGVDRSVPILVGVADVHDHHRLARVEALLELGGWLLGDDLPRFAQHVFQRLHALTPRFDTRSGIDRFMLPPFPVGSRYKAVLPVQARSRLL